MFEVGQKVRVISRKRLQEVAIRHVANGEVIWSRDGSIMFDFMVAECGREAKIEEVIPMNTKPKFTAYKLTDSNWFWDEWMLELVE